MDEDLSEKLLKHLELCSEIDSLDIAKIFNEDHQKIVGVIKSIQATGDLITVKPITRKVLTLTKEGEYIIENGSYEHNLFNCVPLEGIKQVDLMKLLGNNYKIGFSKAMSHGWIYVDKSSGQSLIKRQIENTNDKVKEDLIHISNNCRENVLDNVINEYKKRKFLQESTIKSFILSKGSEFSVTLPKFETDLSYEILLSASWKDLKFKSYNFDALGSSLLRGHFHPLLKVRTEFRQIFLEMGFSEMPTNNYIESSFWNFDALFQPQQHPARDAHDTFFLKHPLKSYKFPQNYLEKVKQVHSIGGYGSQGYTYDWELSEAQKNLLRTHTTAVSARMLYKLANQEGGFNPVKYFSIDKVFRNETLDATHLAEFHQVEGVIADVGLTLGDLIGILYEFFRKLGIIYLKFKPAYNPYTEPSMEIFCFHPGLNKWIEVGNSGIFRPEMLQSMGLPANVNVIAWGLSLERPTMIKYGVNNIRDLIGPKVDLKVVEENPICRLEI